MPAPSAPPIRTTVPRVPRVGPGGGAVAVGVIIYAGQDIYNYKPCRPLGWGNALTWIGDRLADQFGEPCGACPSDGPTEAECRAAYNACNSRCSDEAERRAEGTGRDLDHAFYMECTEGDGGCKDQMLDCQSRIGK